MNRAIDYRTDFYSLGVTFYELLTNQLPFESLDALELVHCHIAKQPTPPHEINPQIPLTPSDFEPLIAADGLLAGSVGQIIGVGPSRGIGLLFIRMEILAILLTFAVYRYPRLRFVEKELPDGI